MEELWDGDSGLEAALDQLVGVEDEEPVVDKGWILGVRQRLSFSYII